jgi:hypothetical protein
MLLAITVYRDARIPFIFLALCHARAAHEYAICTSLSQGNRLAHNGSIRQLHIGTGAQEWGSNADNVMDLHHTIMRHRVIVSKAHCKPCWREASAPWEVLGRFWERRTRPAIKLYHNYITSAIDQLSESKRQLYARRIYHWWLMGAGAVKFSSRCTTIPTLDARWQPA